MAVPYYSSPICQALHSPVHFLIIFTMVTLSTLFHKVITLVILQGNDLQLKLQKYFRFLSYKKNELALFLRRYFAMINLEFVISWKINNYLILDIKKLEQFWVLEPSSLVWSQPLLLSLLENNLKWINLRSYLKSKRDNR